MLLNKNYNFGKNLVSLDLETTGLSPGKDKIIEIGAVKTDSNGNQIEEFNSLVNPGILISDFIENLTGISNDDVLNSLKFVDIVDEFQSFLDDSIIIGHNIEFDLRFLSEEGLKLNNKFVDTWRFSQIMLPDLLDLSLGSICNYLDINQQNAHRALSDSKFTLEVFLLLSEKYKNLDNKLQTAICNIISGKDNELFFLFNSVLNETDPNLKNNIFFSPMEIIPKHNIKEKTKGNYFNYGDDVLQEIFSSNSEILNKVLSNFSYREQQLDMSKVISDCIKNQHSAALEAGTGVGKSLAYLLPAAIFALKTGKRVLVSTNTINLQDQLYLKDLPLVKSILSELDPDAEEINFSILKGRDNYLCIKNYGNQFVEEDIDQDYSRFLAKIAVWLSKTETGEKSELGLSNFVNNNYWRRIIPKNKINCYGFDGPCFLRNSREKAESSNIIIVNHALLMTDLKSVNSVIPDYDVLIIDEAHNLEDVASQHLGWKVDERDLKDIFRINYGKYDLIEMIANLINREFKNTDGLAQAEDKLKRMINTIEELNIKSKSLFKSVNQIVIGKGNKNSGHNSLRIDIDSNFPELNFVRNDWNELKFKLDKLKSDLIRYYKDLKEKITGSKIQFENWNDLFEQWIENWEEAKNNLDEFLTSSNNEMVYWIENNEQFNNHVFFSAPINVSKILNKNLFENVKSVILTSATLNSNDEFNHLKQTTGLNVDHAKSFGSPFDYDNSVEILLPTMFPEPNANNYQEELDKIIFENVLSSNGRAMVLFTSYKSLRNTQKSLKTKLEEYNINVLAQGVDGNPYQIIKRFKKNPKSLILGTLSFWEGVDIDDGSLDLLIITKLPFDVPTHPLFEARSAKYDNSFIEYALPRAILKFKQGFGRLIRNEKDTGKVLLLDSRITSKRYGKMFLEALPGGKKIFLEPDFS